MFARKGASWIAKGTASGWRRERAMNDKMQDACYDSPENIVKELRATFREEAYELLAELESALLELEKNPDDKEQIGRAFRAMHTIKGRSEEHTSELQS